jgi:hypothetical protein
MTTATEKMPAFCPQCTRKLMVPVSAAGKQGRCPACSHVFVLEAPVAAAVVEPLPDLQPLADLQPIASGPYAQKSSADDYALQPLPPQTELASNSYAANQYGSSPAAAATVPNPYAPTPPMPEKYSHGFGWEHKGWDAGMIGGLVMMAIALVWFFGGLALGVIFYYPPILFIVGLVGFFRGLFTGNVSGQ